MNQNKKTILYLVTQSELGGVQRYVFDLAKNLQNEFNIAIAFGEQGEAGELAKQLKQANIEYHIIPHLKRAISPINDLKALIEIIKLINKLKPDIIHLNSSKISILGSLAGLLIKSKILNLCRAPMRYLKSKIIYTVHGWVFNEPMPKWKKLFYKYAEKFTAIFKHKIICVSEFDKQTAIKEKICNPKKLTTIHNGIKPINFLSKEEAKQKLFKKIQNSKFKIISKFKIQNSKFLVGVIANLYPTKGLEYLIQAIHLLISNYQLPITAIIIGEGEERKNLEDLIGQLNLKSNIILTGRIDNAAKLLPAFDIYVCSSVKEGLSYTIIEAMQAGLPIVATEVGGNPELIRDYKTGLLTETKNPQMLAEKIIELINNSNLQQKLGDEAKQKAEAEFSLKKMIEKTKKIYQ
ncbi:glycosyltransferase family 4 protein [Candidatus Parcubacteria bacterium]|nr:glycosyltransferase family 4 protein [Candidatus Parcubacteria bacterium]